MEKTINWITFGVVGGVLLLALVGVARAADTICSVDDDFNGAVDFWCPAPDADHDGYATDGSGVETGTDCDDHDMFDYVGVAVGCTVATGAKNQTNPDGWKVCQSDGTYTTCTANSVTPYCPAGCLSCKYWDAGSGSDSNPGTFASPYQTAAKFTSLTFSAGSCNFLKAGTTHTDSTAQFQVGDNESGTADNYNMISGYPGPMPTLTMAKRPIHITASYWKISNLIVTGSDCHLGASIYDEGCVFIATNVTTVYGAEIANLIVHDNTFENDNNGSGLMFHSVRNASMHHILAYNNHDDDAGNTTGQNIYLMRGQNYTLHHIVTIPVTAGQRSIHNKHANWDSSYTIRDSILYNTDVALLSAGRNVNFHDNLVIGGGVKSVNIGGTAYPSDWTISYNTFKSRNILTWNPTYEYSSGTDEVVGANSDCRYSWPQGPMVSHHNVWVSNGQSYSDEYHIYNVYTYGPDDNYDRSILAGMLQPSENCYYNPDGSFSVNEFGSASGDSTCGGREKGATYSTFAAWQAHNPDTGSHNENPVLDSYFRATSGNCSDKGWLTGDYNTLPSSSSSSVSSSSSSSSSASSEGTGTNFRNRRF